MSDIQDTTPSVEEPDEPAIGRDQAAAGEKLEKDQEEKKDDVGNDEESEEDDESEAGAAERMAGLV